MIAFLATLTMLAGLWLLSAALNEEASPVLGVIGAGLILAVLVGVAA